ncbi:hypothetical protein SAMN05192574_105226 [Mucilaginibacter gossypiicola]|uniref:Uncharacterized protein n=1 Tax=Mucilaginibacter gossypiicola TaxID=551995 RepID=A0A1H8LS76_9SPHI|nr:hypothetical protein [Mucilaginibacter gossypiicola]SEO07954.1 hypothetical protein SAMN05192574_105226 [Mucilaginibacter gossypiicola]
MESLSVIRKFYKKVGRNTRCGSRTGQPAAERTAGNVRHGFLKHRFLSFTGYNLPNRDKSEAEFFRSVKNLCDLYGLTEPDVSGLPFPENISAAHAELSEKLQEARGFGCYIMEDEKRRASLTTAKRYDTGYNLYYIPVRPMARIGEKPELKPLYNMMAMLLAYLLQVTKVSYYRDYGYVSSCYESIEEWINEEEGGDDGYHGAQIAELAEMKSFGDSFLHVLKKPFHKADFERAIAAYRKSACCEARPLEVAMEFQKLINDYPKRSLYDSIPAGYYGFNEFGVIDADQYLSFYWGGSDELNEVFFDMVNNDLQESGEQVEPVSLQWFDKPQEAEKHRFDFEPRLFPLLIELNNYLYEYDYAKKHH